MFGIGKIISFVTDNLEFVLLGALVVAVGFGVSQCDRKLEFKEEKQKQERNIEALGDSVEYFENEVGDLVAEKQSFETDIQQLQTLNENLHQEVEKYEQQINQISIIDAVISADTMWADTVERKKIGISNWQFNWNASQFGNGWSRILAGHAFISVDEHGLPYNFRLAVTRNQLNTQIVTGIMEEKGRKKIFVRSPYPGINFTNIQGAIIENNVSSVEKPSRFGIGFNVGGSVSPNGLAAPTVSFGVNYNLVRF